MNPIWVGMFNVTGSRNNALLDGNPGAWVWFAAQAEDAAKLRLRVASAMEKLGLQVVDDDELQEVTDEGALSDSVWELIPEARRNIESVVYGTWHLYKSVDA